MTRRIIGVLYRLLQRVPWRRAGAAIALAGVSLTGMVLAVLLLGATGVDVGPFRTTLSLSPAPSGDTTVVLPPLGSLHLDSHDGPAHLQIRLDGLDRERTEAIISDPATITRESQTALTDLRSGVMQLALRATGLATLGAMILAALVYRRTRPIAWAGGLALLVMVSSLGLAIGTLKPRALSTPRYEGLLANAPAVLGDAQRIADRYDEYATQLQRMVQNMGNLYQTLSTLPVYLRADGNLRVLHVSDLHLNPAAWPVIRTVVENFQIQLIVDTGDITDWGSEPEANFVASIAILGVPYVFVRGNHDSGITQAAVAAQPNAIVLDNQVLEIGGLTIAGIGDPRFTPDKEQEPAGSGGTMQTVERVTRAGAMLAETIQTHAASSGDPAEPYADIALVHDPLSAGPLAGVTGVVLAGHTHQRTVSMIEDTRLMVQGSTGGAGLRGLEPAEPTSLQLSVLYFDEHKHLLAYDDITLGGTGLAHVSLERHVLEEPQPAESPSPSPSPS